MDIAHILLKFEAIEEKVDKLIDVCKSYELANLELTKKIERLEKEHQINIEAEKTYQEERTVIRSKIDNLLVRLEGISDL